jgi:hypothetical protein
MSLHVKDADVPKRQVVRTGVEGEGAMVVKRGYGNECSLMHAIRAPAITPRHTRTRRSKLITCRRRNLVFRRGTRFSLQSRRLPSHSGT